MSPAGSLDEVIALLRAGRSLDLSDGSGPRHDLLDHGLQTAERLRLWHPDDRELQLAGLVHDVGHQLPPRRDDLHAEVAARFVRGVLGDAVAELVRLHVPAKRYLVTTDAGYRAELDQASVISLERQGGEMSPDETRDFEAELLFSRALALRRADDAGKVRGLDVPGLDSWLDALDQKRRL